MRPRTRKPSGRSVEGARPRRVTSASALLLCCGAACTLAPEPAGTPGLPEGELPPPGYGTLRQDEISISITSGDLEVMVTPLHVSVVRVTAPDTERRLTGMASANATPGQSASLFLVSFFSEQPDVAFIPEEVELLSRGVRMRPTEIVPVTPTWGQRRVRQRRTEMAVYAYSSEVDLESELIVAYGLEQSRDWSTILPRIQAERARARARAGSGLPAEIRTARQLLASSPYFEIFR